MLKIDQTKQMLNTVLLLRARKGYFIATSNPIVNTRKQKFNLTITVIMKLKFHCSKTLYSYMEIDDMSKEMIFSMLYPGTIFSIS